ncbi:endoribonuclease LACTB2 isoform X2 [Rhynchophorus ferrugineus]|uniref:endoribonuclease LACTB2 isoform X2 n=2 Tax=Rhynchophorus ferrugineus TaxID=354439 RepID=UPI003FCCD8D7
MVNSMMFANITRRLYSKMAAVIPAVTRISPRIIRVLGCNPGAMTLQGTNTYIVGTGKRRILIDTGDNDVPQYINHLRNVLQYDNIDLAHIFLTHWHPDHIGGLEDVLDQLPEQTKNCEIWKFPLNKDEKLIGEFEQFKDGQEISVEGATIRVIHTPGHTKDHVSLHLLEEDAVFSGDCILGEGTAVFEDLYDYMESLRTLLRIQPEIIYPGHGNVIYDPIERIQFYLNHRQERETQIMEILRCNERASFTEGELVDLIYQNLPKNLAKAAAMNVNHHLQKLLKEEKVKKLDSMWQHNQTIKSIC